jgi:hypothetical protein
MDEYIKKVYQCKEERCNQRICYHPVTVHIKLRSKSVTKCRAMAQAVSRRLPITALGFDPRSDHVGFVVDKVALGKVFSEYFGFPCQFSFHTHPGLLQ